MSTPAKTLSASHLFLMREHRGRAQVLLQLRQNNWMAGWWDASAAGHVDIGESMTDSLVREAREEIGIIVEKTDAKYVVMMHSNHKKTDGQIYYDGFFFYDKWAGKPTIIEKKKISELKWFDIDDLPQKMMHDRRQAIENYIAGINYSEFGWE